VGLRIDIHHAVARDTQSTDENTIDSARVNDLPPMRSGERAARTRTFVRPRLHRRQEDRDAHHNLHHRRHAVVPGGRLPLL